MAYLKSELNFLDVHQKINGMGLVQSECKSKGVILTLYIMMDFPMHLIP